MRFILFSLLFAPVVFGQTVTGVTYDPASLSHSQVQVIFTSTGWVGGGAQQMRTRYGTSSCTGGTGGTVMGNAAPTLQSPSWVNVGGMAAATTYHICPELSNDGSTWQGGVEVVVTTLALPAVHPALPQPPVPVPTDMPNTSGYVVSNVASDCSDYKSKFIAAISARGTTGTIINLPAGVPCTAQITQYDLPVDTDVHTFDPSAVNTTANTITLPTSVNEGQVLRFGNTAYTSLPGSGGSASSGPLIQGMPYFWHITSGNTGQVYSCPTLIDGSTPACSFAQGTLAVLTDQGTVGTGAHIAYVTEPRSPNWVIVRTATPDAQFVPEHSRLQGPLTTDGITPDLYPGKPTQWLPLMANIHTTMGNFASTHSQIELSASDVGTNPMLTHIRFMGIYLDTDLDPYAYVTSDPSIWGQMIYMTETTENIIFDRCWVHYRGTPERVNNWILWNGMNNAWIDGYIDGAHFWHSAMSGLGISGTIGGTSATVGSGTASYGVGRASLASTATISWSGTPTVASAHRAYMYFTMTGNQFDVVFPPGVTGTCTGVSNCHVVAIRGTGSSQGAGQFGSGTSSLTIPSSVGTDNYYVDPIVAATSGCTSTNSLYANLNTTAAPVWAAIAGVDVGVRFTSDVNQYLCGIRFFKNVAEGGTTHTFGAWTSGGTSLATATSSGESASGWQTATLGTPVAITTGSEYIVAVHEVNGTVVGGLQFQNTDFYNANLHVQGAYIDSNGTGVSSDNWPKFVSDPRGWNGPYGAPIAFVDLSSAGVSTYLGNADLQGSNVSGKSNEGAQAMIAGIGPGPYKYQDMFQECSGNCWHHDESGGFWDPGRNDYTYVRNYWRMPAWTWWTGPYTDGMRYGSRHFLEWKAGKRILIRGNIFNRTYSDASPTGDIVELSSKVGRTIADVNIEYNSVFHSPGGFHIGQAQEAGCCRPPTPGGRYRLHDNIGWDITGGYCAVGDGWACPVGGILSFGPPGEDTIYDHNTQIVNTTNSTIPVLFYGGDMAIEGVTVTNNFLVSEGSRYSLSLTLTAQDSCVSNYVGESTGDCKFTPSFTWANNVFMGFGVTTTQMQTQWPSKAASNYFNTAGFSGQGWFNSSGLTSDSAVPDMHLVQGSSAVGAAGDRRNVGADIDALNAAQGVVDPFYVPNSSITSTTATVVLRQPDTATCSLDYSSTDPAVVTGFTRVTQSCTPGRMTFSLTGLTTQTQYFVRFNGAVSQPLTTFRTQ